jgi:hypothetical protein
MNKIREFLPYLEIAVVYSFLFFGIWHLLPIKLIPYIFIFVGIIFALFYRIMGMIVASIALLLAIISLHHFALSLINLEDGLILIMGLLLILIVGYQKGNSDREHRFLRETDIIAQKRIEELKSQIAFVDMSHKKFLGDSYFRVDRPTYLYHELRQILRDTSEELELFSRIFAMLYRYTFVEGGIVYKRDINNEQYVSLFRYGISNPIDFYEKIIISEAPEWFRLLQKEKQIISLKVLEERYQFVISIPIMKGEEMEYVIVVERIRYTMKKDEVLLGLYVLALALRFNFEKKLYMETLFEYSFFKDVLVFKPEIAEGFLKKRLALFEQAKLSYKLAFLPIGNISETKLESLVTQLELQTREFDEKFLIGDKLFVLFGFAEELSPILAKFKDNQLGQNWQEIKNEQLKKIISLGDFSSVDS